MQSLIQWFVEHVESVGREEWLLCYLLLAKEDERVAQELVKEATESLSGPERGSG